MFLDRVWICFKTRIYSTYIRQVQTNSPDYWKHCRSYHCTENHTCGSLTHDPLSHKWHHPAYFSNFISKSVPVAHSTPATQPFMLFLIQESESLHLSLCPSQYPFHCDLLPCSPSHIIPDYALMSLSQKNLPWLFYPFILISSHYPSLPAVIYLYAYLRSISINWI